MERDDASPLSPTPSSGVGGGGESVFSFAGTAECTTERIQVTTPLPLHVARNHRANLACDHDVCSVCLSPFAQQCATPKSAAKRNLKLDDQNLSESDVEGSSESEENLLLGHQRLRVVTKCQHAFHQSCLEQVKTRKAECPNCRAQLTPIAPSIMPASPGVIDVRATIVSNANRVRHNMQLAAARRRAMVSDPHE